MTAKICTRTLFASIAFASTEQTRPYLHGVWIEIDADGATYVAMDGHRLAARRVDLDEDDERNTTIGNWLIPTFICKALKPSARSFAVAALSIESGDIEIAFEGVKQRFAPPDVSYPDWRRIVPSKVSGKTTLSINGNLLASVDKYGSDLGLGVKTAHWNDDGAAVFSFPSADAFCIVMPMRNLGNPVWAQPRWLNAASAP